MTYQRKTLANSASFEGIGLHSAAPVKMTVRPGEEGIAFRYGTDRFEARPENVTETTRSTKLGTVCTIEHMMSALAGLEITDAEVELNAPEVPGLDGSALPFFDAMEAAGTTDLGIAELPPLFRRLFVHEDPIKIAISDGNGHWRYDYETGDRWPNAQSFEFRATSESYREQLASARTFAFFEEVPKIIAAGLGLGLDENSVLILGPDGYKNEARFPDEPARHKLLDLIGDLYLSGVPIRFLNVVAEKSGHRTNISAASMIRRALENKD